MDVGTVGKTYHPEAAVRMSSCHDWQTLWSPPGIPSDCYTLNFKDMDDFLTIIDHVSKDVLRHKLGGHGFGVLLINRASLIRS